MPISVGTKLGPYEIISPLGAGGMGEVYRARDTRLDRFVALKLLPESLVADADRTRRFEQEARSAATLNHPNIVSIFDIGQQSGVPFIVTELLEGETLRDALESGRLRIRRASDYALQIARGLSAAHEKGIIHRDLKPENIFITRDGQVKILDFGLAKQAAAAAEASSQTMTVASQANTIAGTVLGTAGYMSPEQVRGGAVDRRSDIFAFGAILYEMLSGARAFHRDSGIETMTAILKEEPPDLDERVVSTSPGLERIIRRCLEKQPERRFQSASDLAFAIEALTTTASSTAQKAVAAAAPKRRYWLVAALGALAALAAATGLYAYTAARRAPPTFIDLTGISGYIGNARFSPDGRSAVFGAATNGSTVEVYSVQLGSNAAFRSFGYPPGDILAIADNGDMLISLNRRHFFYWEQVGTLARVSLSGGAPRPLLDNICDADISHDSKQIAIVRCSGSQKTLEYPIGNVLYRTNGWIEHPRINRKGDLVAFLDHPLPGDDRGFVAIMDTSGKLTRLTQDFASIKGLAWSPDESEVWFTSNYGNSEGDPVRAVTRSGRLRLLYAAPTDVWIQDVTADGKMLMLSARSTSDIIAHPAKTNRDEQLGVQGQNNVIAGLSDDGSIIAVTDSGSASGSNYLSRVIRAESHEAILLGEGNECGITADGKWVLSYMPTAPSKYVLYPTGTGDSRAFDLGDVKNLSYTCNFVRDGSKAIFGGAVSGSRQRAYLIDIASGTARPVTPEGTSNPIISPDGHSVVALTEDAGYKIFNVADGTPRAIKGMAATESPIQWDATSTKLYVWEMKMPGQVYLLDPVSGERTKSVMLSPSDQSGVLWGTVLISPDGKSYVFRYRRLIASLFFSDGLHTSRW